MQSLLARINKKKNECGGDLSERQKKIYRTKFQDVIRAGRRECPIICPRIGGPKRVKQTKESKKKEGTHSQLQLGATHIADQSQKKKKPKANQ